MKAFFERLQSNAMFIAFCNLSENVRDLDKIFWRCKEVHENLGPDSASYQKFLSEMDWFHLILVCIVWFYNYILKVLLEYFEKSIL